MRLISFRQGDQASFGAVIEGRVVDLGRHLPEFLSLRGLLDANALVRALDTVAEVSPDYRLDKVTRLAPVTDPEKVLCVFDETRDEPVVMDPKFVRGADEALPLPSGDTRPLAAGLALVLDATRVDAGEDAPAPAGEDAPVRAGEDAPAIAGVSLMVYLSPGALAMGPWLVTADELDTTDAFTFTVEVSGQMARVQLSELNALVAGLARSRALGTGDVVAVLRFLPEIEVSAEDRITLSCEPIGQLSSRVSEDQPEP